MTLKLRRSKRGSEKWQAEDMVLYLVKMMLIFTALTVLAFIIVGVTGKTASVDPEFRIDVLAARFFMNPSCFASPGFGSGETEPYTINRAQFTDKVMAECYPTDRKGMPAFSIVLEQPGKESKRIDSLNWNGKQNYAKRIPVIIRDGTLITQGHLKIEGYYAN